MTFNSRSLDPKTVSRRLLLVVDKGVLGPVLFLHPGQHLHHQFSKLIHLRTIHFPFILFTGRLYQMLSKIYSYLEDKGVKKKKNP